KTEETGLAEFKGWWYSLTPCDPDQDGDIDFVAGNLGLNSKYQASMEEPLQVYYHDYDRNGSKDVVLVYFNEGQAYPVRGRSCSSQQIPELADQFPTYDAFSKATMTEIFGPDLSEGLRLEATWMASSYIENQGNGQFKVKPLPIEAQFSTAHAVAVEDLTGDGIPDIVLAGNMLQAEVETCRHDASIGTILKGDGKGNWSALPWLITGFFASGDVKDLAVVKDEQQVPMIIVSRSNGSVTVHTFR
ncbi:MAG: VCBS repeat-containing protein, partial [Bacteroidota bacterium]